MTRIIRLVAPVVALGACLPVATPRLPQSVAAALAQHPMRSAQSEHVRLYFPEGREAEATRFLVDVERCAGYLTRAAQVHNEVADQKMVVLLPELPFNNAFVAPRLVGYDTEAVIPTFNTTAIFMTEMGQPPDPSGIACHELTHYVQFQQIAGFSWFLNTIFGAVYTPQLGLDPWFDEGLAVYYETRLRPGAGRLASPFWRGAFAAGFAGRRLDGGDLHALNRAFHGGNQYLVGSQFVRFLADRYGEEKLWKLVQVQARSIFFPLWVNLRFWQVYDKTLSTLIDEFADEVQANLQPRSRPASQLRLRPAGNSARYARARDGTEALITQDHDRPPRLVIYSPDGALHAQRNLIDILPPRRLAIAGAALTSGLSFTADGGSLYFVALDDGPTYQAARLLRYDVDGDSLRVVVDDLRGTGGSVSPDGTRYFFAEANGDHHDLASLDLRTRSVRTLSPQPHGAYLSEPRISPDGRRVVATRFEGQTFEIAFYDAVTGAPLDLGGGPTKASRVGPVSDPSWVDDQRIVYLGSEPADAGFQVHVRDLASGYDQRITNAPYLAFEPRGSGGRTVRFLNREGWGWTLDEVPLPPRVAAAAEAEQSVEGDGRDARGPDTEKVAAPAGETAAAMSGELGVAGEATAPASETPAPARAIGLPDGEVVPADDASRAAAPVAVAPAETAQSAPGPATGDAFPGPRPAPRPVDDQPYSSIDHLFVPLLHGPTFQTVGRAASSFGLVLSGNDRLSRHRWTVAGSYQTAGGGAPSVLVGYSNRQLAPLTFELLASQIEVHDVPPVPPGQPTPTERAFTLYRRDRLVTADVTRSFYGNPVELGASLIETFRPDDPAVLVARRRFAGPRLGASYTGAEETPYGGARRLFSMALDASAYPRAWNTVGFGFIDGRTELTAVVPLPLSPRHSLFLGARARDLVGSPRRTPLLQVGGYTDVLLGRRANRPEIAVSESALLPPGLSFAEPLRGFEDHPLLTDRIFIADVAYRYPFIVDWGSASTLAVLPAFFVQQLDLEWFAAAATGARANSAGSTGSDPHAAAGGALTVRLAMWEFPISLQYQAARRVTDDHGWVQIVTLGL